MSEKKYPVKRGKEYEFKVEKLAFGGFGVARIENYVIFIKNAIPGDVVMAKISKRKSSYAEARLLSIITPSELRVDAPCPYFSHCGGCTWQNMSYDNQLLYKRAIVQESVERISGMDDCTVSPVALSHKMLGYRNKMEFSFSDNRWLLPEELGNMEISKDFALGLHVPGTFDKILHIENCLLQSEIANKILLYVSDFSKKHKLQPYGIRSHKGFLRFLMLRESTYSGKIMVNIITAYEETEKLKLLADELMAKFSQVAGVVNNINSKLAQIAVGEYEILLAGESFIQEKLAGMYFNISANSFFQTNTAQAEKLYEFALDFADLKGDEVVWDLYSGTGTIGLILAKKAKKVIGFEVVESAVEDAFKNAKEHQVENIDFIAGDLLHKLRDAEPKPDVLITDPPRSGMHEKVTRYITEMKPKRVVYVSCNPTTLARDLKILSKNYQVDIIQPVDMFPQTYHIETVVKLTLKEK
jgi:23S rRNA (uracil1939-C5)-methyltransferase